MASKKKLIVTLLVIVLIGAAGTGYYLYNKPGVSVEDASGEKVVAAALYQTFIKDTASAKANYTNKILEVSGLVTQVSQNPQQQHIILLKTGTEGASVNCTLEGPPGDIGTGRQISIKGICNGIGEGDADLGLPGDVYLVRCYILK